jgi:hypothetical protein
MSDDPDGETCPVCGQPYDHKRDEKTTVGQAKLRADATACKTAKIGRTRTMYVHLNPNPRVSKVVAKRDDDADSEFLGGMFT